jgi:hypothetical protein
MASASVNGSVADWAGGVIPAVSVRLVNRETNVAQETMTDVRGRFRFLAVPVGPYTLTVALPGFATRQVDLTLAVGQTADLRVRLDPPAFRETIDVVEPPPLVDTTRTQMASSIAPDEIRTLPLNGRNYLDLALLAPNVSRTTTRSNERFAETSAVPGTGISIAGQRNLANTFIVDGLTANDDAADLAGTSFGEEVIREFQVITTGGVAEFGRASAGILNIATRSGSNTVAGGGYGFFRNGRWDARNALASRKDPLSQSQFGATLSGPIARNRTFYFANVERAIQDKEGVVTITGTNVSAINTALSRFGYPGPSIETGEFRTGYRSTNVFGRLDHSLSRASRLQVRYSLYDVTSENARGVGGLNTVTRGTRLDNRDHTVAVGWQTSTSRTLNDLRAQWTRSNLEAPANDPVGPAVLISGVANLGTASSSPTGRDLSVVQIADTVTASRGRHIVKAGADLLYNRLDILFPGALQGSYTFTSLANLERGTYQQFQQAFGEPSQFQSNPNLGLFVQDEWAVGSRLVLNAGLRYDLQWLPGPIALDTNNVSPRIGVAWSTDDGRTVVRANGGVYFDRIPLRATSNALQRDGVRYKVAVLSFGQEGAPAFPALLGGAPDGLVSAITTIDPAIQNGRSAQFGTEVEREIGRYVSVGVGYSHVRGHQIIMSRNVNVPTLTAAQAASLGIPNLGRPNPDFANISRFESIGDSWFNGLTLSVNSQPMAWGHVRLSYTLSEALDTAGNAFFSTPQDNFDIAAEKGPSDNDQRHRLVVSGTVDALRSADGWAAFVRGVQVGYVVSYATGVPFNVVAGSDLNNDTTNNDRPAGVGRNSARQPSTSSVDVRLSRTFALGARQRVQALVEAFNVLNHVNVLVVNNTFGTGATPLPSFGQPTTASDPRQIQVGIRWSF